MASTNDSDDGAPEALPEGVTERRKSVREPGTWGGHVSRRKMQERRELDMPVVRSLEAAWRQMETFAATLDWTPQNITHHFLAQGYTLNAHYREKLHRSSYAEFATAGQAVGLLKAMDRVIAANTPDYDAASHKKDVPPLDIPALRAQIMAIHDTIRPPEVDIPPILRR